jgi:hypothetical protein
MAVCMFMVHGSYSAMLSDCLDAGGDAAVVLAALCYSLTTVRIGFFAARLRPLQLALAKSSGLATLAAGAPCGCPTALALHSSPKLLHWLLTVLSTCECDLASVKVGSTSYPAVQVGLG